MPAREMLEIANDRLSAAIDPNGAELVHLRDAAGRELMTDADPAYWTGHAPLLFPIVGTLNGGRYRLDGREYALPRHGFARRKRFDVTARARDALTLRLADDAETRAVYPFAFALDVSYRVEDARLSIDVTLANNGEAAMPASFGFHPAFAWPLPYGADRAAHRILFAADEPAPLRLITPDGLIAPAPRPSPLKGRELALHDALFEADALVWDHIQSDSVRYGAPGTPGLEIAFPDTPMLGIWTKPGARFLCIEPWHGIADPQDFTGEIWDKPGICRVEPGDEARFAMRVALTG